MSNINKSAIAREVLNQLGSGANTHTVVTKMREREPRLRTADTTKLTKIALNTRSKMRSQPPVKTKTPSSLGELKPESVELFNAALTFVRRCGGLAVASRALEEVKIFARDLGVVVAD